MYGMEASVNVCVGDIVFAMNSTANSVILINGAYVNEFVTLFLFFMTKNANLLFVLYFILSS